LFFSHSLTWLPQVLLAMGADAKSGLGSFENYLCAHSSALNFPQEDPKAERVDVRFPR